MKIVTTKKEMQNIIQEQKQNGKTIGFVPTMGYLHEGHGSLIEQATKMTDFVVVSVFVNPLQFGPQEDYDKYPRDLEHDQRFAESYGAHILFHPSVEEMYPYYPIMTKVKVDTISNVLCGSSRPGHFDGVATVLTKLFHIVNPDYAFFGLKDAQQVAVVSQMVSDLNFPVEIVPCPIVREKDGLAKSSRNVYLNPEERKQAVILYQSLQLGQQLIEQGEKNVKALKEKIKNMILTQPLAEIDYIEIVTYPKLESIDTLNDGEQIIIALAVKFGKTRLIDNCIVKIGG